MANNKDYKVIVTLPRIEYSIPSENFTFIKVLSLPEATEYTSCYFADWHNIAIR